MNVLSKFSNVLERNKGLRNKKTGVVVKSAYKDHDFNKDTWKSDYEDVEFYVDKDGKVSGLPRNSQIIPEEGSKYNEWPKLPWSFHIYDHAQYGWEFLRKLLKNS